MGAKLLLIGLVVAISIQVSLSVLSMKSLSSIHLPYDIVPKQGRTVPMFAINRGAAEKSAFDADSMVAYTAGRKLLHIVNFTDIYNPKIDRTFRLPAPALDIAECGNLVAFTSQDRMHRTNPGMVHIYQKFPVFDSVCNMTVGSNPKSLKFNSYCDTIVIANEGPAAENPQTEMFINPEGTVSVVRVNNTMINMGMSLCPMMPYGSDVQTIDFRLFNNPILATMMAEQFVRHPYKGQMDGTDHTFSQSVEPEYVTMDPYYPIAYVSLQENNAIAEVNYSPRNMTAIIHPIGLKNWTNYDIDVSMADGEPQPGRRNDRRGIVFNRHAIESFLQPDAIEVMDVRGEQFLITANEGAPLSMICESCEVEQEYIEVEEAQELAGDYLLSQKVPGPVRRAMNDEKQLGQLHISIADGLAEPGGEMIDRPIFFGGRGISMFRISPYGYGLELAWDSGDSISKGINELYPNAHNHPPFGDPEVVEGIATPDSLINRGWDSWSPLTGAECQSLAIGQYNDTHKVIVVGINGAHALGIFTVPLYSNTTDPSFESVFREGEIRGTRRMNYNQLYRNDVQNLNRQTKGVGDLDPNSIVFIPREKTVGRVPLVMVTSRVSGTISLYQVYEIPRHQLLMQRTQLDSSAANATPSKVMVVLLSFVAVIYVTLRH